MLLIDTGWPTDRSGAIALLLPNPLVRTPQPTEPPLDIDAAAKQARVGLVIREPLANGLLLGNYDPGHAFEGKDIRSGIRCGSLLVEEMTIAGA